MNYFFITGSSKGLGKALTELLLESGNVVYGFARTSSIQHENYVHVTLDLNDLDKVQAYEFPVLNEADTIILVNNAGMIGDIKRIGNIDSESIVSTYNINLISPSVLMNSFMASYKDIKADEKLILNISSGAGRAPMDGWSIYCSTKSGLDMFSKVLNEEAIKDKSDFKVLSLSPGLIDSQMQEEIRSSSAADFSNIQRFVDFKDNDDLVNPTDVAKKVMRFINNSDIASEVLCSVRELQD